jgi:hypothetical protein
MATIAPYGNLAEVFRFHVCVHVLVCGRAIVCVHVIVHVHVIVLLSVSMSLSMSCYRLYPCPCPSHFKYGAKNIYVQHGKHIVDSQGY